VDFLFVPGASPEESLGRTIFSQRPNTTLVTLSAATNHVAGLLAKLGAGPPITLPIGDLLFVAHGLEIGEYYVPLSGTIPSPADFEAAVDAGSSNAIRINARLVTPSGGGTPSTITVRLRGCNIGKARPFVQKFQAALTPTGGALNVTAPLHFDEIHHIHGGWVEYLAHKFSLYQKKPFLTPAGKPDRDGLLAAFDAAGLTYLDGTAIPKDAWKDWVPNDIHPAIRRWKQSFDIDVDLNPAVNGQTTVTVHREYRYERQRFTWDWSAPNPGNHQAQLDLLKQSLPQGTYRGKNLYDPAYPWPLYQRYGFANLDDYVNNLDWNVTYDGRTLHYVAYQYQYTVMLPITDPPAPPAKPALKFYNYFPKAAATGPAVLKLDETNGDLFLNL